MSVLIFSPAIRRLTLGAAALTSVSPALAQTVVTQPVVAQPVVVQPVVVQPVVVAPAPDEIVIVGHYGALPDNVESASLVVGYGDLDLSIPAHRDILRHRISLTARYLCDKLGESDVGPGSCRDAATRDAMQRVGTVWAHFAPRGTAWVRPPAWVAPYPQTWVTQYP
ncbi:UrcA family protein [Sphingomonas sp.]|uniref:UrcA family protein n=1 Tax=Sphingomonas sp. TaxID=28214 RepID=UPI0038AE79E9